jgi:hypothetical protein
MTDVSPPCIQTLRSRSVVLRGLTNLIRTRLRPSWSGPVIFLKCIVLHLYISASKRKLTPVLGISRSKLRLIRELLKLKIHNIIHKLFLNNPRTMSRV